MIPDPGSSAAYDRYAYAVNNPTNYSDPNGHSHMFGGGGSSSDISGVIINTLYQKGKSDADFIIDVYKSEYLPGNTPEERTQVLLEYTYSGPYQHFFGEYNDSGFNEKFKDGGDQVGHFLTAVRFGLEEEKNKRNPFYKILPMMAIGHELIGDQTFQDGKLNNGLQTVLGVVNMDLLDDFEEGTDEAYVKILNRVPNQVECLNMNIDLNRAGNSIEDLRLTNLGFQFAKSIVNGSFSSNNQAAKWLNHSLK